MFRVRIASLNQHNEIEWEETVESRSMRGARSKATRFIKRQVFESDFAKIDKRPATGKRETWWIE